VKGIASEKTVAVSISIGACQVSGIRYRAG
jgi:hypothetical protein